jgi:hypothetical protein
MRAATTDRTMPPLAAAFLALSDDGDAPEQARRSALAVLLMVAAIALATPLAWLTPATAKPSTFPLATTTSKAVLPAPGDDGAGA